MFAAGVNAGKAEGRRPLVVTIGAPRLEGFPEVMSAIYGTTPQPKLIYIPTDTYLTPYFYPSARQSTARLIEDNPTMTYLQLQDALNSDWPYEQLTALLTRRISAELPQDPDNLTQWPEDVRVVLVGSRYLQDNSILIEMCSSKGKLNPFPRATWFGMCPVTTESIEQKQLWPAARCTECHVLMRWTAGRIRCGICGLTQK